MTRQYAALVSAKWSARKFLCVGLDSEFEKLPQSFRVLGPGKGIAAFNAAIVEATKDIVCSFKPNAAFYEAHGSEGIDALRETIRYIHAAAPDVPVILDAKRGDIGNTNAGYVSAAFEDLEADAITVHPYLGSEALAPFLERKEKGIIVLCRTSNPGSGEFQDLVVEDEPLYVRVARTVAEEWNRQGNCSLVVGATYPEEMSAIRAAAPEIPFLIPGIGTQGGDLEASVRAAKNARDEGFIISASRSVLFASVQADFADAARESALTLHGAIQKAM
jgi:orotidine-5'-phosphate decarboxylase